MLKSFFKSKFATTIIGWIVWAYMVFCHRTIRWTVFGREKAKAAWAKDEGMLVASWHSMIIQMPAGWAYDMGKWPGIKSPMAVMNSWSPEGDAMATVVKLLGLESIRGSKAHKEKKRDKGGIQAAVLAIKRLRKGGSVCITPDGPRGPAGVIPIGPVTLAIKSGARMLPFIFATSPCRRLNTWDRLVVPYPFTKGAIVFGTPIEALPGENAESVRQRFEQAMHEATRLAEETVGLPLSFPDAFPNNQTSETSPEDS